MKIPKRRLKKNSKLRDISLMKIKKNFKIKRYKFGNHRVNL